MLVAALFSCSRKYSAQGTFASSVLRTSAEVAIESEQLAGKILQVSTVGKQRRSIFIHNLRLAQLVCQED